MIKVYHLAANLERDTRLAITDPLLPDWKQAMADDTYEDKMTAARVAAALDGMAKGYYAQVATVTTESLEDAFRLTNTIDALWFETNTDQVKALGRFRSSSIGDVFEDASGAFHVVDTFGFAPLAAEPLPEAA